MNLADQCVELLVIDDDSLTEDQLKSHLDGLYENSARLGLSSDSVTKLVRYLIGTERISERTKIYVLENHLLPREFVASDCVRLILRTLGVCTVFRPYKECISKKLASDSSSKMGMPYLSMGRNSSNIYGNFLSMV